MEKIVLNSIWEPIIKGKFGEKSHDIPLRWMSGRLKQRLESRVNGKACASSFWFNKVAY